MNKKNIVALIAIAVAALGVFITARSAAPSGIEYDPADEGYCEAYGIKIDSTQVDTIYLQPESILANPEAFLNSDLASLLLANRHVEANDPMDVEAWVRHIEVTKNLSIDERKRQIPNSFTREILAGKETFCKIATPHILSYLPEGTEISTTYYLAALDPINTGFYRRGGILIGLSHPMYNYADKIFGQGSTSIYNIMIHELFHRGYRDAWLWQIEQPLENGTLRDLIRLLQNDGMAVNAAYRVAESYSSSLDFTYPLHDFEPYIRYMIRNMNQVLENAPAKPVEELNQDVSRLYRYSVHYIVGGYMAGRIEDQLGREALVATVETGPLAFIQAYNSVAEDGMRIHFVEQEDAAVTIYQELRTAALEGNLTHVREMLDALQASAAPLTEADIESQGYLIYNTGHILLRDGHLNLAEDLFRLHIRLFPEVGAAFIGLGDVYYHQGDIPSAIENYHKAMDLDPHNQWVSVIIQPLKDR